MLRCRHGAGPRCGRRPRARRARRGARRRRVGGGRRGRGRSALGGAAVSPSSFHVRQSRSYPVTSIHGGHVRGVRRRRCVGERGGGQRRVDAPLPASGDQQADGQQIVAVQLEVAQVAGGDELAAGAEVVGELRPRRGRTGRPPRSRLLRCRHCSRSTANQCSVDGAPRSVLEGAAGRPVATTERRVQPRQHPHQRARRCPSRARVARRAAPV